MLNSGKTTKSSFSASPRRAASRILASLPAKSPMVGLIWARAILIFCCPALSGAAAAGREGLWKAPALGAHQGSFANMVLLKPAPAGFQYILNIADGGGDQVRAVRLKIVEFQNNSGRVNVSRRKGQR